MRNPNFDSIIGKGIIFPLQVESGNIKISEGQPLIDSSIRIILEWVYNTKPFQDTFGSIINDVIEDPILNDIKIYLENYTKVSLNRWEKRILVYKTEIIEVSFGKLQFRIYYYNKVTKTPQDIIHSITY